MSSNIAISGLNAITEQLDAISNNIANSGTVGFKSGRAEFAALYAQSQPLGVGVTRVSQSITRGGNITASANPLDMAISGNGFFMVRDSGGNTAYTRAGYFGTDDNGNLVNNQGMNLQGYPVDADGNVQVGTIGNLNINSASIPAKASSSLDFTANLDAGAEIPKTTPFDPATSDSFNNTYSTQVYDSLGREHTMSQYFVKTADNTWQAHYYMDGTAMTPATSDLTFTPDGVLSAPTAPVALSSPAAGANDMSISLNYGGSTQYGSAFDVSQNKTDGYASGEKTGQQIDEQGNVYATYSNGERLLQGQIILANFTNPDGLASQDGTCWTETSSSGRALTGAAGSGQMGAIKSGALEGSNVDLTSELVGLMTAQRNYQANTKVISTDDNMMTSLMQAV